MVLNRIKYFLKKVLRAQLWCDILNCKLRAQQNVKPRNNL